MTNTNTNMRTITIAIVIAVLAFLLGVMFAPYLHADTFTSKPAACQPGYIVRAVRGSLARCVIAPWSMGQ